MRFASFALISLAVLATTIPAVAVTNSRRRPTSSHALTKTSKAALKTTSLKTSSRTSKSGKHVTKPKARIIGQRSIDDQRATQIQSALVKAGYLSGEPSGHWDAESEAAMQKMQSDNGWQTKLVPDSRALIKLGLGPTTNPGESLANPPTIGSASSSTATDR